ncbi:hypothetical protein BDZ89DRAFT_1156749 [Hymenopellis radicata]|nr:hypothetical protein BDZ89DRAFT_1156749 [Hymenopellis radicata]
MSVLPTELLLLIFDETPVLSQFRSRVISEANGGTLIDELRIADHVHDLKLFGGSRAKYKEDELEILASELQHMKALRGLTWFTPLPETPTIFSAIQTTCKGIQNFSLHLWNDSYGDDYMSTLFGFKGLTRLNISARWMSVYNGKLPSSMVGMIRASPNLVTLYLSLETYGKPRAKWDVDTLFRSIDIAPTTLRLREAADLDLHTFIDSTKPTPFRSFLLSHHDKITSLALLRHKKISHTCYENLKGPSTGALNFPNSNSPPSLKASHLRWKGGFFPSNIFNASFTFALDEDETADTIGSQLLCLNLPAVFAVHQYARNEEFVRTLAKYCASLVTVENLYLRDCGLCWVTTILRKEGGIELEVANGAC